MTNEELYGTMMRATYRIQEHRMLFNEDNIRQVGTPLSNLILGEPRTDATSRS